MSTIKQEIPNGWIASKCRSKTLKHTSIPFKEIITDWLWRNQHAEPVFTTIIPESFQEQDVMFANYYHRLNLSY